MGKVYSDDDIDIIKQVCLEARSWRECSYILKQEGIIAPDSTLQTYASERKWPHPYIKKGGYWRNRNRLGVLMEKDGN